jgi:hypothetical protein
MKSIFRFSALVTVAIGMGIFASNAQSGPTNGLIAFYPCTGNANDASGNGHDGIVINATLTRDRFGNANSAYICDGTKKAITIPALGNYNATGTTISLWVQTTKNGVSYNIVQGAIGTFYMNVFKLGTFLPVFDGTYGNNAKTNASASIITSGNWVNLTATNDGSTTKLYVNGTLEKSYSETLKTGGSDFIIGNQNFEGSFDDIRIYNRAISASEVSTIYNLTQ